LMYTNEKVWNMWVDVHFYESLMPELQQEINSMKSY
jgi:hypothetical protein